jgi:endonuclease YncB( thermonuclease family)
MRRFIPLVLLCSLFLNFILLRQLYLGRIVSAVYDGDSFVLVDGTRVRLMGVDAPEMGRCMSGEAKTALHNMIVGKHVLVKNTLTDSYGRLVANVVLADWVHVFGNSTINREMVAVGLAKNLSDFDDAANIARSRGLGIYSPQCRSTVPPSKCVIKGNIQQEGKFYFPPGCKPYANVIVDLSYGDEWFCTESDAVENGFILAPTCR